MAQHGTHKSSAAGKRQTVTRRTVRNVKRGTVATNRAGRPRREA